MNILVTAVGSFSAEAVIKSLKKDSMCKVIGTDINPAGWLANSKLVDKMYQSPLAAAGDLYIQKILEICQKESIEFIIPLTDPEVDILSENYSLFKKNNIVICISEPGVIQKCRDKYLIYEIFKDDELVNVVPTFEFDNFDNKENIYPLFAKPKKGRSSEGIFKINNAFHFAYVSKIISHDDYIIQPFLKGDIFTVDFVRSKLDNKSQAIVRKELIRNFNGAGLTVEIINNNDLEEMACHIGETLDINGCVNFEFIRGENKFYLMDTNPRFSAGIAFSILAGYDVVKNHLNCFLNNSIELKTEFEHKIIAKNYTEVIL